MIDGTAAGVVVGGVAWTAGVVAVWVMVAALELVGEDVMGLVVPAPPAPDPSVLEMTIGINEHCAVCFQCFFVRVRKDAHTCARRHATGT